MGDPAVAERAGVAGEPADHLVGVLVERDRGLAGAWVVECHRGHARALGESDPPRMDVHLPGIHAAAGEQHRPGRVVAVGGVQVHRHLDGPAAVPDGDDAPLEVHGKIAGRQLKLLELVLHRLDPRRVGEAGKLGTPVDQGGHPVLAPLGVFACQT